MRNKISVIQYQAVILILEGDHGPDVKEQALCMLANISDGFSAKEFIMTNEDVLKKITSYLVSTDSILSSPLFSYICID